MNSARQLLTSTSTNATPLHTVVEDDKALCYYYLDQGRKYSELVTREEQIRRDTLISIRKALDMKVGEVMYAVTNFCTAIEPNHSAHLEIVQSALKNPNVRKSLSSAE